MPHDESLSFWTYVSADCHRYAGRSGALTVLKTLLGKRTFRPIFTMRLCQALSRAPAVLRTPAFPIARLMHRWAQHQACLDMSWQAQIGPGFCILHGWGIVVNAGAKVGSNVTLLHGATLGQKDVITPTGRIEHYPVVGNGVWVGPHALIVGGTTVGDECIVAASAVVTKSVPPRTMVGGSPAKPIAEVVMPDIPNAAPVAGYAATVKGEPQGSFSPAPAAPVAVPAPALTVS